LSLFQYYFFAHILEGHSRVGTTTSTHALHQCPAMGVVCFTLLLHILRGASAAACPGNRTHSNHAAAAFLFVKTLTDAWGNGDHENG
jgi:hypothetical protein